MGLNGSVYPTDAKSKAATGRCLHCPCYRKGGHCCVCKARKAQPPQPLAGGRDEYGGRP